VIEVSRWYVIVVSALTAIIGAPVLWRHWPTYKLENKYLWLAAVVLDFTICYGTAEALARHIPGGPRNLLIVPAETWLLVAVAYHPVTDARRRWRLRRALRSTASARHNKNAPPN
jgi:hypothetical protein